MLLGFVECVLSAFVLQCVGRADPLLQEALVAESSSVGRLSLTHDAIALLKNLTEIESITYNEEAVGNWLSDSLVGQGYTVEKQYVDNDPVRFNILAYPGDTRDARLLVTSHIDTVRS